MLLANKPALTFLPPLRTMSVRHTADPPDTPHDWNQGFPLPDRDTQMQKLWLPAIHAQLALSRKNPASAVDALPLDSPSAASFTGGGKQLANLDSTGSLHRALGWRS